MKCLKKLAGSFKEDNNVYAWEIYVHVYMYEGLAENQRLCPFCENALENEVHVLLYCHTYYDIRKNLFVHLNNVILNFNDMQDMQKITVIFSHPFICKIAAKACHDILLKTKFLLHC